MLYSKNILVVTTSGVEGRKIKQYFKPVTALLVAGTNVFSDLSATFSDFFGGRSQSYQRQPTSLYNEAIDQIKLKAYELGANCIVGLSIDMDEVSGRGKAMFMLTAIGTAVLIEDESTQTEAVVTNNKFENVSADTIKTLRKKNEISKKANDETLVLDDELWAFITEHQVKEVLPSIIKKHLMFIAQLGTVQGEYHTTYEKILVYLDRLSEKDKTELLYAAIFAETNESLSKMLASIIKKLQLLDLSQVLQLIQDTDFQKQKRGLQIVTFDKPFYNVEDIEGFKTILNLIQAGFKERGTRTTKKQLLSSKEKEIWVCECGTTNDVNTAFYADAYCESCWKDIFGFEKTDTTPQKAVVAIEERISLISELVN